jgi:hypothetical protein
MDCDIVVFINCSSISNEYLVMEEELCQKSVESTREEELCNNLAKHRACIPYTILQAIPNVSSP